MSTPRGLVAPDDTIIRRRLAEVDARLITRDLRTGCVVGSDLATLHLGNDRIELLLRKFSRLSFMLNSHASSLARLLDLDLMPKSVFEAVSDRDTSVFMSCANDTGWPD